MSIGLEQFLASLALRTQAETVLAVMYYQERIHSTKELTPKEIKDAIEQSRQASPSNISQVLSSLRQQKLVNKTRRGGYSLTTAGINVIAKKVEETGVTLDDEISMTVKDISESLHKEILNIADADEQRYVAEAVRCLRLPDPALRAAVLMGWIAAIYHLRKKVESIGFSNFNAAFKQLYPQSKRKPVEDFHDLEDYKDIELLEVCEKLRVYDRAVKNRLLYCLDLRNGCAHPTIVIPKIDVVKAFFAEIIEYVLTK